MMWKSSKTGGHRLLYYSWVRAFCASVFTTVIRTDGNSQKPERSNYSVFLESVLSLLSLRYNSKYHLCLWNGTTNLHLAAVNFGVPVYLWGVIIVIIFCARYSSRVSHFMFKSSVQVLTTLLHLSYSTMTLSFFYTISYVYVYTEKGSQLRWYFDASVEYGKHPYHCTLLIIAIMFYLFFILPYTIVGIFGSCLLRYHQIHSYFRPFIDTMHAPYRHNKTYWFGLRLLLLQALFTVYVFYQYNKQILVYAIVLSIFLTVQVVNKPYKTKLVSLVDSMSMSFLVVCLVLQVYGNMKEDLTKTQMEFMTLLFLIFLFTVIAHIVMVLKIDLTRVRCYTMLNRWFCLLKNFRWFNSEGYEPVEESDTEDSVRLRESLLAY